MPPSFSLQNVLDVRHSQVEARELELSALLLSQNEWQDRLSMLEVHKNDCMDRLLLAQEGDIDLFTTSALRANIHQLEGGIAVVLTELERLDEAVASKRAELVKARQAEEMLQILKRKHIQVYNEEQAVIESRAQDDIYIARAFRQRGQEAQLNDR